MRARRGCWTCTARRIQCDGALPTCQKCSRTGRECQGYEMRLSWPRDSDKKRAITGDLPPVVMRTRSKANLSFINTTWQDMELHSHLSPQIKPFSEAELPLGLWKQPQLGVDHVQLVHYFCNSAYLSLVTFGVNPSQLRDIIIRMAVADDTVTGLAVFYALLAFSSLRLHGFHQQAVQLKILALHSLSSSVKRGPLSLADAAQHVAASMLLGSFEILIPSESSGEWLWYIWGALNIVETTCLKYQSNESDIGHLLDWLYYHDLLSRFSIHHWHHRSSTLVAPYINYPGPQDLRYSHLAIHRPASPAPSPSYAILNLLSEIYDTLLDPWDPRSRNEDYDIRLRALEDKIGSLPIMPVSASSGVDDGVAVEVYQMAARIYFVRASKSSWKLSTKMKSLIDNVFAGPLPAHACGHFFPVFILACETRTDERRATVLNLIDRVERSTQIKSIRGLRYTVQSIWVQQDLHADSDLLLNYLGIMSAVIDSSDSLPSFA
ncbi:fungal-specific transcription factor domain-containing protein [Tricladium varicosporioides]|nr:fungal-specific transcription factor domain-containing protein [Hymenoscyphus varicosporioides]